MISLEQKYSASRRVQVLALLLVVFGLGLFVYNQSVFAITSNGDNIPQNIRDVYEPDTSGCDRNYGQDAWLSPVNNPTGATIEMNDGDTSIMAQLNHLTSVCNQNTSGGDGSGNILVKDKFTTRNRVTSVSSRLGTTAFGDASSLNNQWIDENYLPIYAYNARYVKDWDNPINGTFPERNIFYITGLGGLKAEDSPYTLTLDVSVRQIHQTGASDYQCVDRDTQDFTVTSLDDARCGSAPAAKNITIVVNPDDTTERRPTGTVANYCDPTTGAKGIIVTNAQDPDQPDRALPIHVYDHTGAPPILAGGIADATTNSGVVSHGFTDGQVINVAIFSYPKDGSDEPDNEYAKWIRYTWTEPTNCFKITPSVGQCNISNGQVVFGVNYDALPGFGSTANSTVTIKYGRNAPSTTETFAISLSPTNSSWSHTSSFGPIAIGDELFASISVNPSDSNGNTASAGSTTVRCALAAIRPTINVHGGDVWAGGDFDVNSGAWCTPITPGAAVKTNPTSLTNFGAYALGAITEFDTGRTHDNILAFANSGANPGSYHTQGKCATDYYQTLDKSNELENASDFNFSNDGQFFFDGDVEIDAASLPAGRQVTLVVSGKATIKGNISYSYGTIGDRDDIPAFVLVAREGIDIEDNVTLLSGLYVAGTKGDPDASHGVIDTCSNGPAVLTYTQCDNELAIQGAFSARRVEFRRTRGNLQNSVPAEHFNLTPAFFLSRPLLNSEFIEGMTITSQKDLPPVY